jgi:STE24 endopeptidase
MNIYALIILTFLIGHFLIEVIADCLNLGSLGTELPEEFEGYYDAESYKKSQLYTRTRTKFSFVTSTFDLLLLLVFWWAGGFNWLDSLVRQWGFGVVGTGLCFMGILFLAKLLLSLPFSIYSTFVLEEKFGFNKTTVRVFVMDQVKGILLGLVLGAPLLGAILYLFQIGGNAAWLYCWLTAAIFVLIVQFIAPTWIMPLFNKFTPLEEGELRTSIMDFARLVDFDLENIFVMDGSKRSSKSNAFFTGFGKHKRIALFDTLIEQHTTKELVAVLAHEIGHYKKKHILQGMVLSILHMGFIFFFLSIFLTNRGLFDAFGMEHMSIHAGFIFFSLLFTPVDAILSIGLQALSRKNEFEADHFAASHLKESVSLITALKKLSVNNLSNLTPHPFYVMLHYSHPPLLKRLEALRKI